MRLRRKPWARPELEASSLYIDNPAAYKGRWHHAFTHPNPLHLELGCGKGGFLTAMAVRHPGINFIGVDIKSEVLALANRKLLACGDAGGNPLTNVKIMSHDIERIHQMLGDGDQVERIYINFCNPWPKARQHKKRLTHTRWLVQYRSFLADGGQVWFKTDDRDLFEHSKGYFARAGFQVLRCVPHMQPRDVPESVATEHEQMFRSQGLPIYFLIAACRKEQMPQQAVQPPLSHI